MTETINFLKEKTKLLQTKVKKLFVIQISSLSVLIIFALAMIGVFAYTLILNKEKVVLEEKIAQKKDKIVSLESVETKQVYLKSKTKSLTEIISEQKANQQITEAVFALLPEDINVDSFSIDNNGGVVFSASTKEFKSLTRFFNNLESTSKVRDMKLAAVKVGGVSFNYEEGYSFNIYLFFEV